MSTAPSPSQIPVEDLIGHIHRLEARLDAIEKHLGLEAAGQAIADQPTAELASQKASWGDTAAMTGLIGQSLLGLALAYLLRAFTENGTLPAKGGVALGLAYALAWLLWAARTPAAQIFTIGLRALTSALIFLPLIWEAQVRFQAASAWFAAGALVFFSAAGLVISWRKNLTAVALISSLAGLFGCCALLLRTHDLLPYTAALLALALAVEASACLEHYLGERWIVAGVADLAVLLMTIVATRPPDSIQGYAALARGEVLSVQIALVIVYLLSTIVRTLGRGFRITVFEIAQCVAAVAISSGGAVAVAKGHPAAIIAVGLFCALCGLACYVVSFAFLGKHLEKNLNFHTYATFGIVMALAGTSLLFKDILLVSIWAALAIFFLVVGREAGRMTLKLHAGVYLVLGTFASGAAFAANSRFLGAVAHPGSTSVGAGVWITAAAAVLSYFLLLRGAPPTSGLVLYRIASILLASTALWNLAGLAAALAGPLCPRRAGDASAADFCPTLLTLILIGFSIAATSAAQRYGRPELKWMAILLTATATYKLLVQDLQHGYTFAVVLSLLIYGGALVLLPRLFRRVRAEAAS